jgi:hypothetical protein
MPVILAIWEAKMGRIEVPGQPRQKNLQDPILIEKNLGHCDSSDSRKVKTRESLSRSAWAKIETLFLK